MIGGQPNTQRNISTGRPLSRGGTRNEIHSSRGGVERIAQRYGEGHQRRHARRKCLLPNVVLRQRDHFAQAVSLEGTTTRPAGVATGPRETLQNSEG